MPEDRIEQAFKEIGFGDVKVTLQDGKIVSIPAQEIERPKKAGVRTVHKIDEEIVR